ncbi:zinc finger protein 436-like [Thalassophryne amazonica]|uniref:zinc finger protein 436-like n=1 Tax=Thalassophryne amazonica TaxID=390379 RepID=UPI0014714431|nr:zinc finger protein 436-like [Thalassophryne amazonica]
MSKVQMLRALVKQRLTAAAEEIFGLFERTIAEYEEELCRSKEENHRQRHLLDAVFNPEDVQQVVVKETDQVDWSSRLDPDEPQSTHIKKEPGPLQIRTGGDLLRGLEEVDFTNFTLSHVPVKSEEDEDKLHPLQLPQSQTEANGEAEPRDSSSAEHKKDDSGNPEPNADLDANGHLQQVTNIILFDFSDPEMEHSVDLKNVSEPQSAFNSQKHEVSVSDQHSPAGEKPFRCSHCSKRFGLKGSLSAHMITHTGEKPFSCSECGKKFGRKCHLKHHMVCHSDQKPFRCSECSKMFRFKSNMKRHMKTHAEEKPVRWPVCR